MRERKLEEELGAAISENQRLQGLLIVPGDGVVPWSGSLAVSVTTLAKPVIQNTNI